MKANSVNDDKSLSLDEVLDPVIKREEAEAAHNIRTTECGKGCFNCKMTK